MKNYFNTDHLEGLWRRSPCCHSFVDHTHPITPDISYSRLIAIHCTYCLKTIKEFELVNDRGEVVWPPKKEWIDRQPAVAKRKRCRRKVPLETDPEPYRILY